MKFNLDRTIELCQETEFSGLYSWSLHECDSQGHKIGVAQIPWMLSLYFTAREVVYSCSVDISEPKTEEDAGGGVITPWTSPLAAKESVHAVLYPGRYRNGQHLELEVSYSMFGTGRNIKQFDLQVVQVKDESQEKAELWGGVSYTTKSESGEEKTISDEIVIYLGLCPTRFQQLAGQIKNQQIDNLEIRLFGASGFYSNWPPLSTTERIKLLAASEEQRVIAPESISATPPRLGSVAEFQITATRRQSLKGRPDDRKPEFEELKVEAEEHLRDVVENKNDGLSQKEEFFLEQLKHIEATLGQLKAPILFILLILFFFLLRAFL